MEAPRQIPRPPPQILDESKDPVKRAAADQAAYEKRLKEWRK